VSDWVEEGRVEVGVVGARPVARTLEAKELMPDELVVVVPATHPWASRRVTTLADLQKEPMVVRERGSGSRDAVEHALQEAGISPASLRLVGEMGSTQAVKQAVRAGVGIALISKRAVEDECRAGLLTCVKVKDLRITRAFHLVTHRDRTRSPLAEAFVEFIESQPVDRTS
jgi:DNA-binding transcriptional LysR family regulator